MRFATDDRVTVTDPSDRHYSEHGIVQDYHYGMAGGLMYAVLLDGFDTGRIFTVDQLDFTNTEEGKEK